MCIIVDANAIGDMNRETEDALPVLKWLLTGKGAIIVGGKIRAELKRSPKLQGTFRVLNQAGKLHDFEDAKVQAVADEISEMCFSNDPHVIAIARISGCRLIYSRDKDLHRDAQNQEILNPKASIYQNKDHKHLLTECRCKKDG